MITTTENIDKLPIICMLCNSAICHVSPKDCRCGSQTCECSTAADSRVLETPCYRSAVGPMRREKFGHPAAGGGRICDTCEGQFSRKPIKSEPQSDVEKDYAAFLKGKRDYGIKVQITCADGSEILSPVSDRMAKAFLRG